ncbi:mitochondrial ATP-dependent RNA helicase [Echria macrotheca]|uniref:RNA helicase n=1 Tax=Echria macrotheca TaxID=438768 RepID=A0AAJ0BJI3_9PEZI|nr:mitochondrial ATP-dependent RNA helicase [Echria macrotheca]
MTTLLRIARRSEYPNAIRIGALASRAHVDVSQSRRQSTGAAKSTDQRRLRHHAPKRHDAQPLPAEIEKPAARIPSRRPNIDRDQDRLDAFGGLILNRFSHLERDLLQYETKSSHAGADQLKGETAQFREKLIDALTLAKRRNLVSLQQNPLFFNLRNAFIKQEIKGLVKELKYSFESFILQKRLPKAMTAKHMELADMRFPYEWYPATRMMQRTIHLHVGPTNSGKTYNALKALEEAKTGIYAGPLRLLAHEIYSRIVAKGKPCALVTGEERRYPEDVSQYFQSCTVEMTPLNTRVDVAVIDEIQMIADPDRGWAWTKALLGVQAKEVHLCGEERTVPVIQELCARIGDKVVVHQYERLNPLKLMNKSLGSTFANLEKGDCVVSFSRVGLHKLKATIERETGRRCAIVYGSLPPETRVQQAALFNDPDNDYDFLVASDAIGMGLNLEIRRVVFEAAGKYDGIGHRLLKVPEVKQIGGRAGRYKTAKQANDEAVGVSAVRKPTPGYVTALDEEDLPIIHQSFRQDAELIQAAGIQPPDFIIEKFSSHFHPATPFSFVLARLRELCRLSDRFFLCDFREMIEVAEHLHGFDLSIRDRLNFMACPVQTNIPELLQFLKELADCVANNKSGHLLDFKTLNLEILGTNPKATSMSEHEYLMQLETVHKGLTMYLWLSYRYEGIFQSQQLAFHVTDLIEEKIRAHLETLDFTDAALRHMRQRRRQWILESEAQTKKREGGDDVTAEDYAPTVESGEVGVTDLVREDGASIPATASV